MLVLKRSEGQSVVVGGDDFLINVVRISDSRVEVRIVDTWFERTSIHQLQLGDSLQFATQMQLKVVDVDGKVTRLGFEVPPDTPLYRKEILDAICE